MKRRKIWPLGLLLLVFVAAVLVSGFYYLVEVQDVLWKQSVADVLEVTTQGTHALDTYIEKDMEELHGLANGLSREKSDAAQSIQEKMELFGAMEADVFCIDLESGKTYRSRGNQMGMLSEEQLSLYEKLTGQGVLEPALDIHTGVWTVNIYECFSFSDGVRGIVKKTQNREEMAKQFSLSFFKDTGFSYVVNQKGDILIHSKHRNSNRTFQNLFDIIDLQGNDTSVIQSFRKALQERKSGVARFQYQKEDYVFCYVPMSSNPAWYTVSIIPNSAIMAQTENMLHNSRLFFILIVFSICVFGVFILLYRNATRSIVLTEEKARKAAESTNLAKSRFLSNMSHDIRTPMNVIIGMTRLAREHLEEPERVKGYLENIEQSGQLLVSLVNDILDLSKIESGKMALHNEAVCIRTLVDNIANLIKPASLEKKQEFQVRFGEFSHKVLCLDVLRLNQVLINLLSNAVKFTQEGGSVSLTVTEKAAALENHAHFTFCVTDNGIGMQPEFTAHIFESFAREQDGRISKIEGSGLGMAIVKMIVDMMKGSICVESTPGKGSEFTVELDFLLPTPEQEKEALQKMQETNKEREADVEVNLRGRRILLAEDNALNRTIMQELLSERGAVVEATGDGQACVDYFAKTKEGEIDLILMDVHMPVLDGYEATRQIRSMNRRDAASVPVFAMTADAFLEDREEARKAGMNVHLSKPLDFERLLYEMKKCWT